MDVWGKAWEVFVTGVVGVYLVMFLLQILTQLGTAAIDRFETWQKSRAAQEEAAAEAGGSPERVGNPPC